MDRLDLISECSILLAKQFLNDPIIQYQIEGLKEPETVLYWYFRSQLEAYDELNAVDYMEDARGCFAYYCTESLAEDVVSEALNRKAALLLHHVSYDSLKVLARKTANLSCLFQGKWYRRFWNGPVCSAEFVVIDPVLKGTGAFRKLFISVVERYLSMGIPVVGQTTNANNVPLYEHCGFSVIESVASPVVPFDCFYVAALPPETRPWNLSNRVQTIGNTMIYT